ncbi:hypothetical protein Bca52824_073077 [Brassica carinata]|uniref:apyrase n=1 Tax=Brassica carinata TaxID=52824 RepID=A0A8X7QDC3_BRACI|nr:hypothetical protein Bca52824_073077 [Brassica carinata]
MECTGLSPLTPGLSAYSDNPAADLVYFAKAFIPVGVLKVTDISQADGYCWYETVQEHILQVSRKVLRSSGFTFLDEWASVISGSDEGIYAWVIANYAFGSLGGDPLQTTGIVELGGASALCTGLTFSRPFLFVAFVSSEVVPPEFSRTISYVGVAYKIYSHSFLHYGQDTAQEDLYESLQNSGYMAGEKSLNDSFGNSAEESRFTAIVQAAANFSQCRSLTFAMLQKGKVIQRIKLT